MMADFKGKGSFEQVPGHGFISILDKSNSSFEDMVSYRSAVQLLQQLGSDESVRCLVGDKS